MRPLNSTETTLILIVAVSTQAAQRELLPPGVIAVLTPIVVGFLSVVS